MKIPDSCILPAPPRLETDTAQVFLLNRRTYSELEPSLEAVLSQDERARADRFVFPKDRQEYIVARAVLRQLLGDYLHLPAGQLRFHYSQHGKPSLVAEDGGEHPWLRFNLSHAGDWVAYAFTRERDVGIDIEARHCLGDWREMAPLVLNREELNRLDQAIWPQQADTFLKLWTRKEAYLKGRGVGLSTALTEVTLPYETLTTPVALGSAESECWWLYTLPSAPSYEAALAVAGTQVRVKVATLPGGMSSCI